MSILGRGGAAYSEVFSRTFSLPLAVPSPITSSSVRLPLTQNLTRNRDVTELRAQKKQLEERVRALEARVGKGVVSCMDEDQDEDAGANGAGGKGASSAAAAGPSSAELSKLKQERDGALSEVERLRVELESERTSLEETRARLKSAQDEVQMYMSEMESIAAMYDKAQAKNSLLAVKMADHEKEATAVMQTKLTLVKQASRAAEDRDAARRALEAASAQALSIGHQLSESATREADLLAHARELETRHGQERLELEAGVRTERETWAAEKRELKRKLDKAMSELEEEKSKRYVGV